MKLLPLFFTFLLLNSAFIISHAQSWVWAEQPYFTGNPPSQCFGNGTSLATDRTGNVYETGNFGFAYAKYGNDTLIAPVGNNFLVKYDTSGNILWARSATLPNGVDECQGGSVALDPSGNVYITGNFYDKILFDTIHLTGTANGEEVFTTKYDANGKVLWARQSTPVGVGTYRNFGTGIATDRNGNVYVSGTFSDSITFGPYTLSTHYSVVNPYYTQNVFLVKYDSTGNVLWARQGVTPTIYSFAYPYGIATDGANNIYLTGQFYDTISFGGLQLKDTGLAGDLFVVKYDENGNAKWVRQTTNHSAYSFLIRGASIATDKWGGVYVTGSFGDTVNVGGITLSNPVSTIYALTYGELMLIKYDSSGNVRWAENASPQTGFSTTGWSITADDNGHLFLDGNATNGGANASLSMGLGGKVITSTGPASPFFSFIAQLDTGGNALCGSAIALSYKQWLAADHTGQFVYMGGGFLNPVTVGPDALSLDNNPPNEGTTIPYLARWKPCDIVVNNPLTASANKTDATCHGLCNGTATATGSGGTAPYTYRWNTQPVDTAQNITGLCAGGYTVTITDNTGATAIAGVTVNQPAAMTSTLSASKDTVCQGDSVTLYVTGDTTHLVWQYYTSGISYVTIPGVTGPVYTAPQRQNTQYRVIAGNGVCKDTSNVLPVVASPTPVPVVTAADTIICSGDSTQLCAPPGFAGYYWNTQDTSRCIFATQAGDYYVSVTATNGCTGVSPHQAISVYPVPSNSIIEQGDTLSSYGAVTYQWLLNGDTIPGATKPVYVVKQTGYYSVQTTDSNGCFSTSTAVLITLGLQNLHEENISIYPNPSVGNWQLSVGNELLGSALEIFDEQGRMVWKDEARTTKYEITAGSLPSGVYYLRISNDKVSMVRKLVKL